MAVVGYEFISVEGGIVAPDGFMCSGIGSGIKKSGKRDVALLSASTAVPTAAVFTTNSMAAAPVVVSRRNVASGLIRAVITNSGNANACTGPVGEEHALKMAEHTAGAMDCAATDILVASTGVIGVELPIDVVLAGIIDAVDELDSADGIAAAEAIMTTDTFPKQIALSVDVDGVTYTIGGMAKGSGMIMPNMATMLGYVTTDAPLTTEACSSALKKATERTFNRISVDGDTSTNDMVVLMASGEADGGPVGPDSPAFASVSAAIEEVCRQLARMIVRDGEGATKLVTVTVKGALTEADAHEAAMSVANSPLFKTAVYGKDANWGRVVMAVGKSGAEIDPAAIEVVFAGITVCKNGTGFAFDEQAAAAALEEDEIDVVVDLHMGQAEASVMTCDLSYEYVRINGDYRT